MPTFDFSKPDQSLTDQLYGLLERGIDFESRFDAREFTPVEVKRLGAAYQTAVERFDKRPTRAGVRSFAPVADFAGA